MSSIPKVIKKDTDNKILNYITCNTCLFLDFIAFNDNYICLVDREIIQLNTKKCLLYKKCPES